MATSSKSKSEEGLAEEGALTQLFSSPARANILDTFVENSTRELNVSDIARLSDTSRSTIYDHLEFFLELGIVEEVETGTTRYTLTTDDEIATTLNKLQGLTLQRLLELDDDVEL